MNRKFLLTVLGVGAAGYLAWTITHKAAPPAPAPAPVAKIPAKPRTAPAPRAVAPPVTPKPEPAVEPAPTPPTIDPAALAISDPDAFVKSLSTEQNRKLSLLLSMKIGDHITESQKYQLDADMTLMMLDRNPTLALTDGQKQMLSDVKAVYRTKMDAALGDKFAQVDEIDRKMSEIYAAATSQNAAGWDTQDLRYKQFEVMGAIHETKTVFETDYQTSVRACLTPDQAKAFDDFTRSRAASGAMLKQMADQIQKTTPANGVVQP